MRTALITGTSSGFGLATTIELAGWGWHLFATMRNLEKCSPLQEALTRTGLSERVTIARLELPFMHPARPIALQKLTQEQLITAIQIK